MATSTPKGLQLVKLEKDQAPRGRGRPPRIPIAPKSTEVAQLMKNKQRHMDRDPLVGQLTRDAASIQVLDIAMMQLAKEASSLDFERSEAERKGEDTSTISAKKITAVKAVIDTFLRKWDNVVNESFDFKSKKFQRLFEFFVGKFRTSCEKSGMPEEQIQKLFQIAAREFEDWESEALRYIKSDGPKSL